MVTNHHTGIGHPLGHQSTTSQSRLALPPGEDLSRANNPLGVHSTLKSLTASHSKNKDRCSRKCCQGRVQNSYRFS